MSIATDRPQFSPETAITLAQTLYGVPATAHPLPSERDQNFQLNTDQGPEFVLKISSAADDEAILDLQNQVMLHLTKQGASSGDHVLCPQVCPTENGQLMTSISDDTGASYWVRMLTYLPGKPLAKINPHPPALLRSLGALFGHIDQALADFSHPAAERDLKWDMRRATPVIREHYPHVSSSEKRAILDYFLLHFETHVQPILPTLRSSIIHNDGNDYNILVQPPSSEDEVATALAGGQVAGVIDFGDIIYGHPVCDLAITTAYAMLNKADPLAVAAQVVAGYHAVYPLTDSELAVLYPLICIRLCTSVAVSAYQQTLEPDNDYLRISEQPAWTLLQRLRQINPRLGGYIFREACGLPAHPQHQTVVEWLQANQADFAPLIAPALPLDALHVFDLSVGSLTLGHLAELATTTAFTTRLFGEMAQGEATDTEIKTCRASSGKAGAMRGAKSA